MVRINNYIRIGKKMYYEINSNVHFLIAIVLYYNIDCPSFPTVGVLIF